MTRPNSVATQNNFSKGLISDATGLNFPENACTESNNVAFDNNGVCTRRKGFDLENNFSDYAPATTLGSVFVTYLWTNVAGQGDFNFVVTQIGDKLHFYKVSSGGALSTNKHATVLNLPDYAPAGVATVATLECQFATGNGYLFVTNRRLNSFYVTYDPAGNTLTATVISIQIRDFKGDTADALAVDNRPAGAIGAMTAAHRYNLQNQGWTNANLTAWDTARADMPSRADSQNFYKAASGAFDFTIVDTTTYVGNSAAPTGHYFYNLYAIDRANNFSGATNEDIAQERVETCAFHAGRVFYSGLKSQGWGSTIFFSQIATDTAKFGLCYQVNDPTSDQLFALLPSDGGTIQIVEAGPIIKMVPIHNALMVFCTNGVWAVTGSQGIGFAANDYSVNKISSTFNVSATSFVDAAGIPYWWNLEGIYTVKIDPQTNSVRVIAMTDFTIRNFLLTIPSTSKQYVRGVYDQFTKRIQWVYRATAPSSFEDRYVFDSFLTLDLITQAFYGWTTDITNVKIQGLVNIFGLSGVLEQDNVTTASGANQVTTASGANNVIEFVAGQSSITSVIKYFVSRVSSGTKVTWAENYRTSYVDWESFVTSGTAYTSYFVTGYELRGQGVKKFQQIYITIFSKTTDSGAYKIQSQWNYAISANSNKWSTIQTVSNTTDGLFAYKYNRMKLRGNGQAVQLRFQNSGNNPFTIVGWSALEASAPWV